MLRIASFVLVVLSHSAVAQETFRQTPQPQPVLERGSLATNGNRAPNSKTLISDSEFASGAAPLWIWGENNDKNYTLRKEFSANQAASAKLMASCDNVVTLLLNGKQIASSSEWQSPVSLDVTKLLSEGKNTLVAQVGNQGGAAGFVFKLVLKGSDGAIRQVVSDESWEATEQSSNDRSSVAVRGKYGQGPWGNVFDNANESRVPNGTFEVLPGFQVEKLFSVPQNVLGSWVCIAFDNRGRLLASDQGDKGICRITLPEGNGETSVEQLDFSKCEFQPSGAQGMLWAFDSMYFCCNGGPGSGLYRARDTDGDDQFDECVRLRSFAGGGEHGPHSLRLSPDGARIYVIAGNHTQAPFKAGEEKADKRYQSRLPTTWAEDLLLPRMWDANGHARGIMAPGGWIASTDADGKSWEMFSIGYRNPYDMAFNADGELFAYDADMEWDVGTPWYRPTRVVHATSGSEFGWRSGTGKWPTYYFDSLPTLVDIGPGSPVGVDFGYGLKYPAKYQRALYICDWTFGTMYAIHLEPFQSSYKATKEEFVARTALPLTDCAAGPDGAMYFTIGGRGTPSELFRVRYVGKESTAPAELTNAEFAETRKKRREIEAFHLAATQAGAGPAASAASELHTTVFGTTWTPDLDWAKQAFVSEDRYYRNAAIRATVPSFDANFVAPELDSLAGIRQWHALALAAISRQPTPTDKSRDDDSAVDSKAIQSLVRSLCDVDVALLPKQDLLSHLRTMSLLFLRSQQDYTAEKLQLLNRTDDLFPADDNDLNRELCQMLVYLESPTVVAKTVALMNAPPRREEIDMGELLNRNRGYGNAIREMIDNQPDKQQMWYAFCLRMASVGWTPEARCDYYRWFTTAQTWSGGNSFRKFLQNIEDEAWQITPFDHRVLVEKSGARQPYQAPELPKPQGPGRAWTIEQINELAGGSLKQRDFQNGKKMFSATRCVLCHRFAGDGGATGPDLTQLAGRFNTDALIEAIIEPSKVISDQYKSSQVLTDEGTVLTGRIVSENEEQISILTDPEDSTQVVDVAKNSIEEIQDAKVSMMPKDLLQNLNKDEVLDLLAYLLSRGDEGHPMFRK